MYITFGGEICSNDWTEFDYSESADVAEKTAGNEVRKSYNVTIIDGDWSLTVYDVAEQADTLTRKLRAGVTDVLAVYPKGNVSGKPLFSFTAIVQKVEKQFKFNENVQIKVSGKQTGALIQDIGSYVP